MKINQVIKDLLLANDTVVIPGLGAFVTQYQSAEIISSEGAIIPPTKSITFNSKLQTDSLSLLENYLISNANISSAEAKTLISDFAKATDAKIKMKGEVEIDEIGLFYSDANDKIAFKQSSRESLLLDNYGMSSVKMPDINEKATISSSKSIGSKSKTKKTTVNTKTTATTQTTTGSNKTLKRVLIALPIIALLVLIIVFYQKILNFGDTLVENLFNKAVENKTEIKDTDIKIDENSIKDTTKILIDESDDNENIDTTIAKTPTNEMDVSLDDEKLQNGKVSDVTEINLGTTYKNYYLIVGSYSNNKNAEKKIKELKNKGFDAEIILNDPTKYRVTIGGFDNVDDAIEAYKEFANKYTSKDIWLLRNI